MLTAANIPEIPFTAQHYYPNGTVESVDPEISDIELHGMEMCLDLSDKALREGNPPIGAVLIDRERGKTWANTTIDKTVPHILGHAEVRAYLDAQDDVGDNLENCTLVTPAQPCNTCTTPYAEGNIGRIIYAAPRSAIFQVSGLMRPRKINMHELLLDGNTDTITVEGVMAGEALNKFALWGAMKNLGRVKG